MRIAIVHYHLKRGGVTRVIETTLAALNVAGVNHEVVILAGDLPDGISFHEKCRVVSGLQYSNAQEATPKGTELVDLLESAARDALGCLPDVWHIHNHSLGKNSSMPAVVEQLAQSGARLLLQMHDFAEDGRPDNHRLNQLEGAKLYPIASHLHYACINGRDAGYLARAGFGQQLHLLPSPVKGPPLRSNDQSTEILEALDCRELLLYPVRAVRRKNFGEVLLWATCLQEGQALATTLGPTNRNFEASYARWQTLSAELGLPLHFGIGERSEWSFTSIMSCASAIINTSIAEGFGLAFLEPWLFQRPIIGRDLPAITKDFKERGIRLEGLYSSLRIPESWIHLDLLESKLHDGLQSAYDAYGIAMPTDAVGRARAGITPEPGFLDFGGLDEDLQESVIRRVSKDKAAGRGISQQLPIEKKPDTARIKANAATIKEHYNLEAYGKRISALYSKIAHSEKSSITTIDPNQILQHYLKPENFRLLRT